MNPYPHDLDAAREHMDTAIAALGVSSVAELGKVKLGYISGFDNEPRVAFLAEAWRQAFGLEVEQVGSDRGVFFDDRSAGFYDIALDGWGADYPHAVNQLDGLFTCGGSNNSSQYCNPVFDALLDRAAAEPDQVAQVALYEEAQKLLVNDAPILPLRFAVSPYLVKPHVSRLTPMPTDSRVPGDYYYETIQILEH
jgi:oligopeptide transport system substrate-binding protein